MTRRPVLAVLLPLIATTGALAFGGAAHAAGTTSQVLTSVASDDAFTSSTRPAYNAGAVTRVEAGTVNGDNRVTYLKFTVPALPAGSTAQNAQLTLTAGTLAFCGHHANANADMIVRTAVRVAILAEFIWTGAAALGTSESTVDGRMDTDPAARAERSFRNSR